MITRSTSKHLTQSGYTTQNDAIKHTKRYIMNHLTNEVFKNKVTILALKHYIATLNKEITHDMDSEDWDSVKLARIKKHAVQELLAEAFEDKLKLSVLYCHALQCKHGLRINLDKARELEVTLRADLSRHHN